VLDPALGVAAGQLLGIALDRRCFVNGRVFLFDRSMISFMSNVSVEPFQTYRSIRCRAAAPSASSDHPGRSTVSARPLRLGADRIDLRRADGR
jgi:hypothetical protein